ncbi:MAG: SprT family zinc-dependent metalloprotease [Opitutales bacterium]
MQTEPDTFRLEYGHRYIDYRIQYRDRKTLRLTVTPNGQLQVIAPFGADPAHVSSLVHEKSAWVFRKLRQVQAFHPLPTPHRYLSGETFLYLGRQYRLKVHPGSHAPAKLIGKYLNVTVPEKTDTQAVEASVQRWYRTRAHDLFPRYLEQAQTIASRHGIPEPTLTIRTMKTRWGSCTAQGRITLNLALIQTPIHCIEYVIMHELCHLKHHNHSKAFYSLLTRCMPDWHQRKDHIDEILPL